MFGFQLTGNIDEIASLIEKIEAEINAAEARVRNAEDELARIADKKRVTAGAYFNNVLSEREFTDAIKNLSDEREKVACGKFDANEHIAVLKAQSLKLSNLRDLQIKAHALERNLKVAGDDYLRLLGEYATVTAAHNSTFGQIPSAERTNYNAKLKNVRSIFAGLSSSVGSVVEKSLTAQLTVQPTIQNIAPPTVASSSQQEVDGQHECTFTTASRFCDKLYCWKIVDQK